MHFKNTIPAWSLSLVMAFVLCLWMIGCTFYKLQNHPESDLAGNLDKSLVIHFMNYQLELNHIILTDLDISGKVSRFLVDGPEPENSVHEYDQTLVAHLYIDSLGLDSIQTGSNVQIPLRNVSSLMLYDVNVGKTVMTYVGISAAASGVIAAIITIVYILAKSSCPFIYADNGQAYDFSGEIYSGAVYPPLERHDYLPLPALRAVQGMYSLRITNEVKEIQHTNLMDLLVVDHPADVSVMPDRSGTLHSVRTPVPPVNCTNALGQDITGMITRCDSLTYISDVMSGLVTMDSLVMTFKRPAVKGPAKLVVRAKNSFWLDYVYGQFLDLFGNKLDKWNSSRSRSPAEELLAWSKEQGFPLQISVNEGNGWKPVDFCNETGPMAMRDLLVPVTLSGTSADSVRVKLTFGAMFWEIDRVGMDLSPDIPLSVTSAQMEKALDKNGNSVLALLNKDDSSYYVQPKTGDCATVSFTAPPEKNGFARSVILHSKGHYEILRPKQTYGPDVAYLQRFQKPGEFVKFANERLKELYSASKK